MVSLPFSINSMHEDVGRKQNNDNDDDNASHAMDEFLQSKINIPLDRTIDSNHDTSSETFVETPTTTLEELYDINKVSLPDDSNIASSNHNKQLFFPHKIPGDDCCNSSSEGTTDQQHSDHTYPETPPTPLSLESHRPSSSCSSSISVQNLIQDSPSNVITFQSDIKGTDDLKSLPSPILLPTPTSPSTRKPNNRPIPMITRSHSLSYNPITSHSPQRKSRIRRLRAATFGMSIFSCLDGDSDDTISESERNNNVVKGIFRPRTSKDDNDDDDNLLVTLNSEEALENAAQEIRSQLLQHEMLLLAAEAEIAANSGADSFTRQPIAGVVQNDMIRYTATTNNIGRNFYKRKQIQSYSTMRRSLSEGSYMPQQCQPNDRHVVSETTNQTSSSFVSAIFPESILPLSSVYLTTSHRKDNNPANFINTLRDVNEVFPTFRSFHKHIQTHFIRNDVAQKPLKFEESTGSVNTIADNEFNNPRTKLTPVRHLYDPFCKDSPSEIFQLPLCTNEMTSTPLMGCRKMISTTSNNEFPSLHTEPMKSKQVFAINDSSRSELNRKLPLTISGRHDYDEEHPDGDELLKLVNALSGQVRPSSNFHLAFRPRTIQRLPGLEEVYERTSSDVVRQVSSSIRLQPKIRLPDSYDIENRNDSLISSSDYACSYDPRALLDETENDSGDEDSDSVASEMQLIWKNRMDESMEQEQEQVVQSSRLTSSDEPLHLLSADNPTNVWTPSSGDRKIERTNSIVADDSMLSQGKNMPLPLPPPFIPDFITPSRLRKIRGIRRRSLSTDGVDTVLDAIAANLLLSTESLSNDFENFKKFSVEKKRIEEYFHEQTARMIPSNQTRDAVNASCERSIFEGSFSETKANEDIEEPIVRDIISYNDQPQYGEFVNKSTNNIIFSDLNVQCDSLRRNLLIDSTDIPESTGNNPFLIGLEKCEYSNHDVFIAKVPSHHDCGCLSLSPVSSTSDDDNGINNRSQSLDVECSADNKDLRKSLSSGALYEVKSWNAFVESFKSPSASFSDGSHDCATPRNRNSIRDAMKILSSKLSPSNNCKDSKKLHDQETEAYKARMKENDEFISNFLYCSKSSDGLTEDVTIGDIDNKIDKKNVSAAQSSSIYMCIDGNMMNCGENDAGICCNGWLNGSLTMGSVLGLPPASSSLHQQRKRSSINVGGLSPTRTTSLVGRELYYHGDSNRSNNNNSSSWLDLANAQLDEAFDAWVLGGKSNQITKAELDDAETCLLHVSFQAPALKKSINTLHTTDDYQLQVYHEIDDESKCE